MGFLFTFQGASSCFKQESGPERARTADLFIANEVFFQLNYRPLNRPVKLKKLAQASFN